MQIVESDVRPPAAGEVRIKVLAVVVGRTDINYRYGYSPFSPKVPFTPGYEIVGVIDAIGAGVSSISVGDRVAALIGHGGYTEMIYLGQAHLAPVTASLDPAEVATLVLNYVAAYQMLHRLAKAKAGDKALVIGASGGVGTALLELGRQAGLKMYGTASTTKHPALISFGAIPIDYHSQDFVEVIHHAEPDGLNSIFDGMGGDYAGRCLAVLRRGGTLVEYAAPSGGILALLGGAAKLMIANMPTSGKSVKSYGASALYARDKKSFMDDLAQLLKMLEEGKIKPIIAATFPILEAAKANELLESGQVTGNIVLLASG
jgi:NADPH:quinone reductase-like Zn-dependent oxidoreductase